jgi:hypothetical protein
MSNLPSDLKAKLDLIARQFVPYARKGTKPYKEVLEAAEMMTSEFECEELQDHESIINPDIDVFDLLDGPGPNGADRPKAWDWTPILRASDPGFDRLCQEFLDAIRNDPRARMDEDDAQDELENAIHSNFWGKIKKIEGDDIKWAYDETRADCFSAEDYARDPYAFYGLSRRDFMASSRGASRRLTAADRSALIRLASTMPVGSTERRAILAGLQGRTGRK